MVYVETRNVLKKKNLRCHETVIFLYEFRKVEKKKSVETETETDDKKDISSS